MIKPVYCIISSTYLFGQIIGCKECCPISVLQIIVNIFISLIQILLFGLGEGLNDFVEVGIFFSNVLDHIINDKIKKT
jgi:hypothetical protein